MVLPTTRKTRAPILGSGKSWSPSDHDIHTYSIWRRWNLKPETQLRSKHPLPRRFHALNSPSMDPGRVRLLWVQAPIQSSGTRTRGKTLPDRELQTRLKVYCGVYELVRGFCGISGPSRACAKRDTNCGPGTVSPFSILGSPGSMLRAV